jgi:NAD(P)H-hydrate repair Nnr-like enzyme with NAD(P)H-hydrate dehydratase domain
MPGAALLAALSALRAGAGILQIATCETHAPHLGIAMPEAMVVGCPVTSRGGIDPAASSRIVELALGCDAVLVGPGMADEEAIIELSVAVLKGVVGPYFVLDAAAFTCLRAIWKH